MQDSVLITLGLGFALGLKHATEADHLAAVSTIVSERRTIRASAVVGALWGLGHTASLLVAGVFVIALGFVIPERVASVLELGVAIMIIALGSRILHLAFRGERGTHIHAHIHGGRPHVHLHFHDEQDAHSPNSTHEAAHTGFSGWRPLLIGMLHGLAGSAALTLFILAGVARNGSTALGLAYLAVFGVGSIGGMVLMSSLIAIPFSLSSRFSKGMPTALRLITGVASTAFGCFYAWSVLNRS